MQDFNAALPTTQRMYYGQNYGVVQSLFIFALPFSSAIFVRQFFALKNTW